MLLRNSYLIFIKDFRLEFRSRYALNAIALFAMISLSAISFSIGGLRVSAPVLAALLWIVIFFSAMSGLAHIFVREEEQQTADTLRLLTPPVTVFIGKWLFNVLLLLGLEVVIIPLFIIFLDVTTIQWATFIPVLILGSIALSTISTIIAAIIAQTSNRGALFAVLTFPLAVPVLRAAIQATWTALEGGTLSACISDLQILFSFSIVMFTASVLLFDFIWRR